MTDELEPGDPLIAAVRLMREPVAIAPGLAERAARRVRRQRRTRIAAATTTIIAVAALILIRRPGATAVHFVLAAPAVQSVSLVGDFDDWRTDRLRLVQTSSGAWETTVRLRPGQYRFAYLVNHEQWRAADGAPTAPDDFGRPTSVITVAGN